jgi:hypothetical protein
MEADRGQPYADIKVGPGAVGRPARRFEELAQFRVRLQRPRARGVEAVLDERLGHRVQEPAAVPVPGSVRPHPEFVQLAVRARPAVRVGGRAHRGEAHDHPRRTDSRGLAASTGPGTFGDRLDDVLHRDVHAVPARRRVGDRLEPSLLPCGDRPLTGQLTEQLLRHDPRVLMPPACHLNPGKVGGVRRSSHADEASGRHVAEDPAIWVMSLAAPVAADVAMAA